jgi:hypothetical protein
MKVLVVIGAKVAEVVLPELDGRASEFARFCDELVGHSDVEYRVYHEAAALAEVSLPEADLSLIVLHQDDFEPASERRMVGKVRGYGDFLVIGNADQVESKKHRQILAALCGTVNRSADGRPICYSST